MNQTVLTILSVFLSGILSTVGATYQANKARDDQDQTAVTKITTEFEGVKTAINTVSGQMSALTSNQAVLSSKVESLQEFDRDANERIRYLEIKVK
ncbi:hypothetical protein CW745_13950 [Psychromonas sp. psych-6C06]|uniref:hypothetical protein n=1 Tax=Psychromonas sp. psych-6C06 TaxID=2058089 RepID=UPI000C345D66|nr:hypothetical protein [Psychromonas sp. psych-6C06]PKF60629.1 hypothetical protein CW745_13950 [Psychromonas sp. psych-6C06]